MPITRPTSAGRRPGSGKRLAPIQHERKPAPSTLVPGAPAPLGAWDDEYEHPEGGDYTTHRDDVIATYPDYDGGGDSGGPPPEGGARGALLAQNWPSLVTVGVPPVDYRPLADALTNIVPEIDELRLDVEDDQVQTIMNFCFRNEEFCIKNEKFCIKNEELCIKNDEICRHSQTACTT